MTLKHLLSFFLILVLFSASLCYAQHKMLRTKEDIQAFNDTMLFSLKENRHAAFSAGISDVWKSLGTGEVTTKMTDYWKNISKQCGALNEVKAYGVTTVGIY